MQNSTGSAHATHPLTCITLIITNATLYRDCYVTSSHFLCIAKRKSWANNYYYTAWICLQMAQLFRKRRFYLQYFSLSNFSLSGKLRI